MAYPNTFAAQAGPIPLSQLDANFNFAVDIQSQALYAAAGGSSDAITATYSPAVTALVSGLTLHLRAASANTTTTPTFSPNGLTAKTIVKANNQALVAGDIAGAGQVLILQYDATNGVWELSNPSYAQVPTNTFGFKNRIINGGMVIDQRNAAASQTFTAAAALAYSVDRWYGYCTGANVTGQQISGGTTPTVTQNRYRFTGAASVTAVGFGQRIEQKNCYDLAGSTCTLSADLAISATLTTVTWTASYATTTADTFGTLASPTVTQIATGTFTVSATVTNFTTNISIPAAATTGIQIVFTVGALTAGLTWTIGNVQFEKGSTATSFDYRPYGTELALCQRYFQSYNGDGGAVKAVMPYQSAASTGELDAYMVLPVRMRSAPTAAISNLTAYDGNTTAASLTSITTYNNTSSIFGCYFGVSGLTAFRPYMVMTASGTTGYLQLSSEL